jgi:hypothetical protein
MVGRFSLQVWPGAKDGDKASEMYSAPLSRVVYIEAADFQLQDSKDYYGLAPNKTVLLKWVLVSRYICIFPSSFLHLIALGCWQSITLSGFLGTGTNMVNDIRQCLAENLCIWLIHGLTHSTMKPVCYAMIGPID